MNKLEGYIQNIINDDAIEVLEILSDGIKLAAVRTKMAGTASLLKIGDRVSVHFKETAMSLGKNFTGEISIQNRFDVTIQSIKVDTVLSKIFLDFKGQSLVSVITTASVKRMQLKTGDRIQGFVKTTDMLFSKIDS